MTAHPAPTPPTAPKPEENAVFTPLERGILSNAGFHIDAKRRDRPLTRSIKPESGARLCRGAGGETDPESR